MTWTLLHNRSHHTHTDKDGDVHTPTKGLFYAFLGWIFKKENHEFARMELFKIKKSLDPSVTGAQELCFANTTKFNVNYIIYSLVV